MNVLFVTWDGPQVHYLEGLFLPIFRQLTGSGWHFHVLQFTWSDERQLQHSSNACAEAGIPYSTVRVWRRPVALGSMLTAVKGARDIRTAARRWDIHMVMPRSVLPVMSTMLALRGKSLPIVFDADGLPLDERVDFGGMSPSGASYRVLRDVEAQGVRRAETVLTRTNRAAEILQARAGASVQKQKFHVVENGRDPNIFTPGCAENRDRIRSALGLGIDAPLLVYAGSLGSQYCLPEMLEFFLNVLKFRPDARFLVLTGSPHLVDVEMHRSSELEEKVLTRTVSPNDIPEYLACADLGLALRQPTFSMQGVSPIKLGEYLLCGLPIFATSGVGDTSVYSSDVGYLVDHANTDALTRAATWFTDHVLPAREHFRVRCREIGVRHHSLESSVNSYRKALKNVSP